MGCVSISRNGIWSLGRVWEYMSMALDHVDERDLRSPAFFSFALLKKL